MINSPKGLALQRNFNLSRITSIKIGGPARYFFEAKTIGQVVSVLNWAKEKKIKWLIIGGASNIIPNDKGVAGLVVKMVVKKFQAEKNKVTVGAGNNLLQLIRQLDILGLAGMEKMAGIPGTVGGAICGCSGAFGQEIKDCLQRIRIFDGIKISWITKKQCRFGYRDSIFKHSRNLVILEAEFLFKKAQPQKLIEASRQILKSRGRKYPGSLWCPGSFFKNIPVNSIHPLSKRRQVLAAIEKGAVKNGKIPAAYLLENIRAKGKTINNVAVTSFHANTIYNKGRGTARDVIKLANFLKRKVYKKFHIHLQEEVQYLF